MNIRALLLLSATLTACSATGNGAVKSVSQDNAQNLLILEKTTKADVIKALGDANITKFDSGYEVWVYQESESIPKAVYFIPLVGVAARIADKTTDINKSRELAILFDPQGVVRKYALRKAAS